MGVLSSPMAPELRDLSPTLDPSNPNYWSSRPYWTRHSNMAPLQLIPPELRKALPLPPEVLDPDILKGIIANPYPQIQYHRNRLANMAPWLRQTRSQPLAVALADPVLPGWCESQNLTPADLVEENIDIWENFAGEEVEVCYTKDCNCYSQSPYSIVKSDPFNITQSPFSNDSPPEHCHTCMVRKLHKKPQQSLASYDILASPWVEPEPHPVPRVEEPKALTWQDQQKEMWYWLMTFLYGGLSLEQAQALATQWHQETRNDDLAAIDIMTDTFIETSRQLQHHLIMGFLVPLCRRWCAHPSFVNVNTFNAAARRHFWCLMQNQQPDCIQQWVECLDVIICPQRVNYNLPTDNAEERSINSYCKMWLDQLFRHSIDLVYTEIICMAAYTSQNGTSQVKTQDIQERDLAAYKILMKYNSWRLQSIVDEPEVKQFEVSYERWPKRLPIVELHILSTQIIAASSVSRAPILSQKLLSRNLWEYDY
ncbi:hypothetical protein EG329_007714 [Mollisiaceae sp. DMI_Dod_QoI]|nr:hypothetical protein EG329_007714 [Helotiales sp. DMI_Dod_QoI]